MIGKVANQRAVLLRGLRDHGAGLAPAAHAGLEAAVGRVAQVLRRITDTDTSLDALRGSEGEAAPLCFGVFDPLIPSPDLQLRWRGRSRRPPLDPINALLSFLYTLLTHDCRRVARTCQDFGQRVQVSVFGIEVDPAQWVALKARLEGMIDLSVDSLRYDHLGANWARRVEHVGAKPATDPGGPPIVCLPARTGSVPRNPGGFARRPAL